MTTEKPSKMITKLLDQTKADAEEIKRLKAQLVAAQRDKDTEVQNAREFARHDAVLEAVRVAKLHADEITAINDMHEQKREAYRIERNELATERTAVREALVKAQADLAARLGEVLRLSGERQMFAEASEAANKQLAEVAPQLALLETQKAELAKLCDRVRDRMKRKELEEESAILNRKAVTIGLGARRS